MQVFKLRTLPDYYVCLVYNRRGQLVRKRLSRANLAEFVQNEYRLTEPEQALLGKHLGYLDTSKRNAHLHKTVAPQAFPQIQLRFGIGTGLRNNTLQDAFASGGVAPGVNPRYDGGLAISGGLRALGPVFGFGLRYDGFIVNSAKDSTSFDRAAIHYFGPELCFSIRNPTAGITFAASLGATYFTESFRAYKVPLRQISDLDLGQHLGLTTHVNLTRNLAWMVEATAHFGNAYAGLSGKDVQISLTRFSLTTGLALTLDN